MDLPRRIIDGGAGDWESLVLASAALDRPSPELRTRLRRDLGLAVGVGLAATTATSKSLGAIGFKWSMLGVLLGVLGAAGASGVATLSRAQSPGLLVVATAKPAPATPAKLQEQVVEPAALVAAVATEQPSAEAAASANRAPASRLSPSDAAAVEPVPAPVDGSRPIGSAQFGSPSESELAAQLAAMRSVRAALAENQAGRALSELDAYEQQYPAGLLLVEAQVLRIDANAALGNQAALARLGHDFLQRHPASPYARHVQSLLDGSKP